VQLGCGLCHGSSSGAFGQNNPVAGSTQKRLAISGGTRQNRVYQTFDHVSVPGVTSPRAVCFWGSCSSSIGVVWHDTLCLVPAGRKIENRPLRVKSGRRLKPAPLLDMLS
jgi:hypothetical protein